MKQVTLTIGHNVGNGERVAWTHEDVVTLVSEALALEGLTAYEVAGMWQGKRENSTRIEVIAGEEEAARIVGLVPLISYQLAQEAIACEVRESATEFVPAWKPASIRTA